MQRPHRSLRVRLQRKVTVLGAQLPPGGRRVVRRIADRLEPLVMGGTSAAAVRDAGAEVVTLFDAWHTVAELAAALTETLIAGGVEVARMERSGAITLAVPLERREEALGVLRQAADAPRWWVVARRNRAVPLADAAPASLTVDLLPVFRLLAAPDGTVLSGPSLAVQLQFWRKTGSHTIRPDGGFFPKGTRVAPVRNGVAPYIVPEQWREAQADPERRLLADASPHLLSVADPIDVVYTWVDGSDPSWQARRNGMDPTGGKLAADALDPARTTNRDELRYSLRSLAMNASWVNHIWLVTDGQVPSWLAAHPKLTVVRHEEIFTDPSALPTFNSHAIECQLHHIEGLAEHFLYLNDDFFFGRPVQPDLFFHGNGVAKFSLSPIAIDREPEPGPMNGAMLAARKGREFVEQTFGRTVTHRMQHVPHAHQRSTLAEFEKEHPGLFDQVAHSRFRNRADLSIASDLGHWYAYARGRAVPAKVAFRYVDIGSPLAAEYFETLLTRRDQDCFCINDVGGYPSPVDDSPVIDFLRRYFPVASPFEHPEAAA
ncbi:MAG TPA: Stealth CR1 domain-containing protein [Propionicimonas sp.]|uniref:stealth family protein n=1 Tax=Propionicimonas sp. TaxID=1955623 RepID=UPI002F40329B